MQQLHARSACVPPPRSAEHTSSRLRGFCCCAPLGGRQAQALLQGYDESKTASEAALRAHEEEVRAAAVTVIDRSTNFMWRRECRRWKQRGWRPTTSVPPPVKKYIYCAPWGRVLRRRSCVGETRPSAHGFVFSLLCRRRRRPPRVFLSEEGSQNIYN